MSSRDQKDADESRRRLLRLLSAAGAASLVGLDAFATPGRSTPPVKATVSPLLRRIPSTGETIPAIGLGSWITFNIGNDPAARQRSTEVIRTFFETGGTLIDSSPMYGSAQSVIGEALAALRPARVFSADKVWIGSGARGPEQIEESRRLWRIRRFDLLQVHNLLSWEDHLPTLFTMKKDGRLRYVGVTTSHGRRHGDLEAIMKAQPLDFVQVTYNPLDREVEQRILPLAADRGIAVIVNRPFQQGALVERLARHPLPAWAREIDARSWAQIVLKFIVSHPAVTCAIPATSVPAHARENVDAARGRMPDTAMRGRIVQAIESI